MFKKIYIADSELKLKVTLKFKDGAGADFLILWLNWKVVVSMLLELKSRSAENVLIWISAFNEIPMILMSYERLI